MDADFSKISPPRKTVENQQVPETSEDSPSRDQTGASSTYAIPPIPVNIESPPLPASLTEIIVASLIGRGRLSVDQVLGAIKATGRKVQRETVLLALLDLNDRIKSWNGFPLILRQAEGQFDLVARNGDIANAAGFKNILHFLSDEEHAALAIILYSRPLGGVSWNAIIERFRGPLDSIAEKTGGSMNSIQKKVREALDTLPKLGLVSSKAIGNGVFYLPTEEVLRAMNIKTWDEVPKYEEFEGYFRPKSQAAQCST
jgi:chromosome segregation and condensation protein ScpB